MKQTKNTLYITSKQYLNFVLVLRCVVFVVNKLPEDGVLLPEHVEVGTISKWVLLIDLL